MYKHSILLLFFLIVFPGLKLSAETYSVTASKLNVRQKPSKKSPILFKLSKGDLVECNSEEKWVEIEYEGKKGFVYKKYLKRVEENNSDSLSFFHQWSIEKIILLCLLGIMSAIVTINQLNGNIKLLKAVKIVVVITAIAWLIGYYIFGKPLATIITGLIISIWMIIVEISDNIYYKKHPEKIWERNNWYTKDEEDTWETPSSDSYYSPSSKGSTNSNVDNYDCFDFDSYSNDYGYKDKLQEIEDEINCRLSELRKKSNDLSYKAAVARANYEEYSKKAKYASDQAYSYEKRADDCRYYYSTLDDEGYLREASECEDNAQHYRDDENDFKRKADEAYDEWQRLEYEIHSLE